MPCESSDSCMASMLERFPLDGLPAGLAKASLASEVGLDNLDQPIIQLGITRQPLLVPHEH